jgi:hypothetical protein
VHHDGVGAAGERVAAGAAWRSGSSRLVLKYAHQCAMHRTKLRLSIQTEVDRKSGQLDEKPETPKGRKGKTEDVLFGGNVVISDGGSYTYGTRDNVRRTEPGRR